MDTKLHEAVRYGDTNVVLESLKEGLDPNQIGLYQWNCVHEAANNGDLEILEMLLQYNGDPNGRDELHGSTAVHYAAQEGHVECLQALIDAGGKYDITNDDGQNCLDVAVGKCKQILDKQRVRKLMRLSPKDARREILIETQKHGRESQVRSNNKKMLEKKTGQSAKTAWEEIEFIGSVDITEEADKQKQKQQQQQPELKKDEQKSVTETILPKLKGTSEAKIEEVKPIIKTQNIEAAAGRLQLSFEYNSKTSILKIRVWHIEDLLLPPVEASMISKVYVKSYLLPDKKGETKRRTEEHKVEEAERTKQSIITVKKQSGDSTKAIFQPSRFKFTKPLEYKKVSKEMVATRTIHLSVCVKQKFSNRSFIIANCQIDLKSAVRKLKRENFELTSCINPTIPSNLHLYSPNDLIIVNQGLYSNITASDPNLRLLSVPSLAVTESAQRASSEGNLREVKCQSFESIPSIAIDIPTDDHHHDTEHVLREITVMDDNLKRSNISHSHPELTAVDIPLPGTSTADEPVQLQNVLVVPDKYAQSSSLPDVRITSEAFRDTESEELGKNVSEDLKVEDLDEEEIVGERIADENRQRMTNAKPGHAVDIRKHLIQVQVHNSARDDDNLKQGSARLAASNDDKPSLTVEHVCESPSPPQRKKRTNNEIPHGISNTRTGLQLAHQTTTTPELVRYRAISDTESKADSANPPVSQSISNAGKHGNHSLKSQETMETEYTFTKPVTQGMVTTHLSQRREQTIPAERRGQAAPQKEKSILSQGVEQSSVTQEKHGSMKPKYEAVRETTLDSKANDKGAVTPRRPHRHRKRRDETPEQGESRTLDRHKETTIDEDLKKKLATPEFKLKMFQRTRREPHPAAPGLETDTSQTDQSDPFFVPGSPVQSPQANQQAEEKEGASSSPMVPQELRGLRRIESPAITRIKASWI